MAYYWNVRNSNVFEKHAYVNVNDEILIAN